MASSTVVKVKAGGVVYDIADTTARHKLDSLRAKTSTLSEVDAAKCSIKQLAASYNSLLTAVKEAVAIFVTTALMTGSYADVAITVTPSWTDHNQIEGDRQTMVNSKAWTEAATTQINANSTAVTELSTNVSALDTKLTNERKDNKGVSIPATQSLKDYIDAGDESSESAAKLIAAEKKDKDGGTIPSGSTIKDYVDATGTAVKGYVDTTATTLNENISTAISNERKNKTGGTAIPDDKTIKDYIDEKSLDPSVVTAAIDAEKTNKVDGTFIARDTSIKEFIDERTLGYHHDLTNVVIGSNSVRGPHTRGSLIINPYYAYPSYAYGAFNICLGIDSMVGYNQLEGSNSSYAVSIGTSNRAAAQHSYAFGSQINSLAANSSVIGYGLSSTSTCSTVIGHGNRSIWDRKFDNPTVMTNFLKNAACLSEIFKGYGILTSSGPGCDYIVDEVLTTPDPITGMYAVIRETPLDIETGSRWWSYGKSHGRGTFNIVAIGNGVNDYGLANVFINDKSLATWTGVHVGEPTDKEIYSKGIFGPEKSHCDHDYTVAIGNNAKTVEASSSCQSIAIGRDALSAGSATVAVGPNSFAYDTMAIALGWRANAVGLHSIAIGAAAKSGQNYFKDGEINPNSDLCQAVGTNSVAIGYNAKAMASNSVQLCTGIVTTPETLQFRNVVIVKEGKLVGNFDAKDLDPKNIYVDYFRDATIAVTCTPHRINTLTAIKPMDEIDELSVVSSGTRNFEMFIPNETNFREGLPLIFSSNLPPNVKRAIRGEGDVIGKLPIMVKSVEPTTNMVIITVESIPDGTDWTPVVDRCNMTYTIENGFVCLGSTSLRGHNLQMATECLLTYPIEGGTFTTNILPLSRGTTYAVGTLYRFASLSYTPPADKLFDIDAGKTWFEIKYKTVNGEVSIPRVEVDILNPVVTYGLTGDVTWVDNSTTEVTGSGHFELACGSKYKIYKDDVQLSFMTNNVPCTNVLTSATYDATNNKFVFPDITGLTFVGNVSTNSLWVKTVDDERLTTLVHVIEK